MNREGCGCRAKGRLYIHVESKSVKQVKIMLVEESNYRDFYTIDLQNGKGFLYVDGIAFGILRVESSVDHNTTIYYPDRKILFEKSNYVHKLTIIDRRK